MDRALFTKNPLDSLDKVLTLLLLLGNLREIIIWRDVFTTLYFKMPGDKRTTLAVLPLL